jgi:hypothetical protein
LASTITMKTTMTTEIKSTQTTRIRALNDELRKDFTSWLSGGTPRWLPHELHNWVNSRTRGGVAHAWQPPSTTTAPTTA